jgi:hypothetical protein
MLGFNYQVNANTNIVLYIMLSLPIDMAYSSPLQFKTKPTSFSNKKEYVPNNGIVIFNVRT